MTRTLRPSESSLAAALLGALLAAGAHAESVSPADAFHFNPPDDVAMIETAHTVVAQDLGFLGSRTEDRTETSRIRFKKGPKGYLVTQVIMPPPASATAAEKSPLVTAAQNVPITIDVDSSGRILDVHGLDKISKRLQAALPPAAVQSLSSLVSESALVRTVKAEWASGAGLVVGHQAKVGETWSFDGPTALPSGGLAPHHADVKVTEIVDRGGRKLAHVHATFTADPAQLGAVVGDLMAAQAGAASASLKVTDAQASGTYDAFVDPLTGLAASDSRTETLDFKLDVPGQGPIPIHVKSTRDARLEAAPPAHGGAARSVVIDSGAATKPDTPAGK